MHLRTSQSDEVTQAPKVPALAAAIVSGLTRPHGDGSRHVA